MSKTRRPYSRFNTVVTARTGHSSGSVTCRKAWNPEAPSIEAAS